MSITRDDVARKAGVSVGTVSNVLNNFPNVRFEIKQKVLKTVEELGYVPNTFAQKLAGTKKTGSSKDSTNNIGCIIYRGFNKYEGFSHARIVEHLEHEVKRKGYNLSFYYRCDELSQNPPLFNKMVSSETIDGLITISTQLEGILEQTKSRIKNIISLGEPLGAKNDIDCVLYNDCKVSVDVVKYFAGLGHKRIGFIGTDKPRARVFEDTLKELHLEYDKNLVEKIEYLPRIDYRISGYNLMKKIIDQARIIPTAMYIANDEASIGALKAIKEKGYKVPGDISIVTCGDIDILDYMDPPITTYRYNEKEIAVMAVNRLMERIANPEISPIETTVSFELIERKSVKGVF